MRRSSASARDSGYGRGRCRQMVIRTKKRRLRITSARRGCEVSCSSRRMAPSSSARIPALGRGRAFGPRARHRQKPEHLVAAVIGVIRSTAVSDSKPAGLSGSGAQRMVVTPSARPHSFDRSAGSAIALVSTAPARHRFGVPTACRHRAAWRVMRNTIALASGLNRAWLVRGAV